MRAPQDPRHGVEPPRKRDQMDVIAHQAIPQNVQPIEARALLKKRFPYYIFLYEAEHVGITATGETDRVSNELVPNEYKPADIEQTTLELYRAFRVDPRPFLLAEARA